jgi:glyoxylase I family protein
LFIAHPILNMHLSGVHHIALIVSDYARSRSFYTELLGLSVERETFRAERNSWKLDLRLADGSRLELFSFPDPPARRSRPEACGLRHLAFAVDDLDASCAHLAARGVTLEPIRLDPLSGRRFTFFADPDGLPLELYESRLG